MNEAVCLRCDWEGSTGADGCPRCGAPLFRAQPRPSAGRSLHAHPPVAPSEVALGAAPPPSGRPDRAERRSAPWRALAGMAALALVVSLLWTRVPRAPGGGAAASALRGTLVYASDTGRLDGGQRLWKLDLATGQVTPGPRVPRVSELLSAPYPGPGWVAFTSEGADGLRRAYVLRGTAPADRPVLLDAGELVAWGPLAQKVVLLHRGPMRGGCRRAVSIDLVDVETGASDRVFAQPNLCGDILSIGRDDATTYFTRVSNGRLGIFYVGVEVAHSVLPGYSMVSVSPASDFLVTPPQSPQESRRVSVSPGAPTGFPGEPGLAGGSVLFWQGRGGPAPIGSARDALVVDRVLAWSADAVEAVVAGGLGDRQGLFIVRAGPGDERRVPRFVTGISGPSGAAFSRNGVLFLAMDGSLFAYDGGEPTPIALPDGAPPPAGPVAWMP